MKNLWLPMFIIVLCWCENNHAEEIKRSFKSLSEKHSFCVNTLVTNLTRPWGMVFLPDGNLLVTERPGTLRKIDLPSRVLSAPITGMPKVATLGRGGLFDVTIHPNFSKNRWVYLSYLAKKKGVFGVEVARGELNNLALENLEVIFRAKPKNNGVWNFGSRLVFDKDGHLLVTLGDRRTRIEAQNINNHLGSIIRINDDGSVPAGNPFVNKEGARPENYSFGHRNVQGAVFNPFTGELWTHEHGPQGG
ncbi:PQQ-dependent sugar dehydrogenase, partial [bacterium AH-315-K03]|nr:PQQ-dependent sugar dehydrogenase [bacterium AH-315-K03]